MPKYKISYEATAKPNDRSSGIQIPFENMCKVMKQIISSWQVLPLNEHPETYNKAEYKPGDEELEDVRAVLLFKKDKSYGAITFNAPRPSQLEKIAQQFELPFEKERVRQVEQNR